MKLTDAAIKQVTKLVQADDDAIALQISVVQGGCSGYQYEFTYATEMGFDKILVNYDTASVLTTMADHNLLQDSTLDYQTSLMNSKFVVTNPSATGCCGCGKSFS